MYGSSSANLRPNAAPSIATDYIYPDVSSNGWVTWYVGLGSGLGRCGHRCAHHMADYAFEFKDMKPARE